MFKNPFEVLRSVLIFHQRTPKAKHQYIALIMSSFSAVECYQSTFVSIWNGYGKKKHPQMVTSGGTVSNLRT